MTDSPGRQRAPEAERREKDGSVGNDRQIAHARNHRGVVPMRPMHASRKQNGRTLGRAIRSKQKPIA